MGDIINFRGENEAAVATVSYHTLKEYEATEDCQRIVLCHGMNVEPEKDSYAVLLMCAPGSFDAFDIVAEFAATEDGLSAAKFAAEIADRTLSRSIMLQPDPDNDYTSVEIDEFCDEARQIFGESAAIELRRKLTGRAA